ncbi:MAG: UDP-N-acetylmuramyl pentapeptide phosphotransferase [Rhodospirillaceae bacterium]|nr:UDP-N-acetylmuramyl pentapeptide phosphotransferase [Rhodospirillaceae bacterium]
MGFLVLTAVFLGVALVTVLVTWGIIGLLRRWRILDLPNKRSSHDIPTPRGGGLAVIPVVLVCWVALSLLPITESDNILTLSVAGGALVLAFVSWIDDLKGVSSVIRLIIQYLVVIVILALPSNSQLTFQGLAPFWLDKILTAVIWVWFINLFNFMDGIDGIASVETLSIGIGITLLAETVEWHSLGQYQALVLAGAAVGFLWWNWSPAKVFFGDVGSVPLGFLLGWLLLNLAGHGFWVPAIILPLYYLVDASLTLFERLARGEKIWEAHRSHYYQQAVQKGLSHAHVSRSILTGNVALVGLSITSIHAPVTGLIGAAAVVFVMLLYFKHKPNR